MRGSIRQGSSIYPGHDSMKSYASSNAIPIGIPDYYLEQHDSMPSLPGAERCQKMTMAWMSLQWIGMHPRAKTTGTAGWTMERMLTAAWTRLVRNLQR